MSEMDDPPTDSEVVLVPRQFMTSDRVRAYHWSADCSRAPGRGDLVEVPLEAAAENPRLVPCPFCDPGG